MKAKSSIESKYFANLKELTKTATTKATNFAASIAEIRNVKLVYGLESSLISVDLTNKGLIYIK
jgi:hypothetical protein